MRESVAQDGALAASLDRVLIARSADGDRDAFGSLLEHRIDGLYFTALAILRHEADARDAVQETCVLAWQRLHSLREPDRFDAWVGRILLNACRGILRSRRRVTVREIDISTFHAGGPDGASEAPALAQHVVEVDAVRRAFLRLRPDERVILGLHHADRRPLDEIASLLDVPVGTVKWRLYSARRALSRALERER